MSEMVLHEQFSSIHRTALQNTIKRTRISGINSVAIPKQTRCGTPTELGPEGDNDFTCRDQLSEFPLPSLHEDGHRASVQFFFSDTVRLKKSEK